MAKGVSPYGDGRAAERIAALVAQSVRSATLSAPRMHAVLPPPPLSLADGVPA
jgi:hypothetical protein